METSDIVDWVEPSVIQLSRNFTENVTVLVLVQNFKICENQLNINIDQLICKIYACFNFPTVISFPYYNFNVQYFE